ncbi:hypothetical protein J7E70_33565 [Variovorax paradoxus]|nr:hypothetical protein [Variovorax paradoxus]MBT2305332.1 hypothetical protein [Variovorax paradoxus]
MDIALMQVRNLHRGVVLNGWRRPSAAVCLSISPFLFHPGLALAEPSSSVVVSAAEQSPRDVERLRILRDELRKSEALVEALGRRKAERLAASDIAGADDAEEQHVRALADVAGLKREIGATRPSSAVAKAVVAHAGLASPAKASPTRSRLPTPWWDVYGKANREDKPGPVSSAKPSSPTDAHLDRTRSLE